ncbi:MAG: alpha/beta fold hydrolase [Deltaproteobacteria bacterium]|nr:alpha/beta fold hydrolase [Deltaproteobacteria bacterium]
MTERVEAWSLRGPQGTLRGFVHRPEEPGPAPAVLLLHGFTGHHLEQDRLFVQTARRLTRAGFFVLRFDFYGSGDSDGEFHEWTPLTEVADAGAALEWVAAEPGVDANRLGLIGLSLGGCVASLVAGQDPRVGALVLWNAVGIPGRHFPWIARSGPEAFVVGGARVSPDFLTTLAQVDPAAALRRAKAVGLVVQGTEDPVVAPEEGQRLLAALGARGQRHSIAGAGHTFQHPTWREELFAVTLHFLQAAL